MASRVANDLERWVALARAQYPDVQVATTQLEQHLDRLAVEPNELHVADLVLACACAAGDKHALAAFERHLVPVIEAAAQRIDRSPAFIDETVQIVRERLLVTNDNGIVRIAEYAGDGPLRAWVRIAAMRIAMNRVRDRRRDMLVDDNAFFDVVSGRDEATRRDAQLRYGQVCSDALRAAFAKLTVRERHLLRMHYLHGLSVDELAPTLDVHRATVARWIQNARERLLEETRVGVRERLAVGDATVDSIFRALAGQLDISVSRLLAEPD